MDTRNEGLLASASGEAVEAGGVGRQSLTGRSIQGGVVERSWPGAGVIGKETTEVPPPRSRGAAAALETLDPVSPGPRPWPAAVRLGLEIRRHRMARGLSQRALLALIGLSAHSNLSDYERGRRIPPLDLVESIEEALSVTDGQLLFWWRSALAERADQWFDSAAVKADGTREANGT
ncbi:helix-turn-helix domain-containing protein [Nocardioides sp.]|uniref:helix-turn-helix domain-containing protein n=1 Tax=Nocardioides sp. TaxID=35761 RepID=UPI0039E3A3E0